MNVWVVKIGEPLPIEEHSDQRLYRTGYLCQLLVHYGHTVTWWTSTFNHSHSIHYFDKDTQITLGKNYTIKAFYGPGYIKHVSLKRVIDHYNVSFKIWRAMKKEAVLPNIILISYPPIETCSRTVSFAQKNNIPVVIDLRDMWPDIFLNVFPPLLKPLAKILLLPKFWETRRAFSRASALFGITQGFLEWGLRYARRDRSTLDGVFPFSYHSPEVSPNQMKEADQFWDNLGVISNGFKYVCYLGSITRLTNLDTIFTASAILRERSVPVKFIICGTGDKFSYYLEKSKDYPAVIMAGFINKPKIIALMKRCIAGLDPIPNTYDFKVTINNKAFEYMFGGLPIITSPEDTYLASLIRDYNCGMSYSYQNPYELAELIITLINNPDLQKRMSENARRLYEEKFQAEKVYQEMIAQLEKIVAFHRNEKELIPAH